jgi:diguanylate cyclase (GGDEF)-like protein/hemerythrin-like metal-binding protein
MHNVKWKPELSVGIKNVDDDHKRLIELTNTLINAIDKDMPKEELKTIFEELEAYTHYHFEREEGFMDEHCSASDIHEMIRKHKEQHRYFTDKLPELKEQLMHANSKSVSYEIVEFLLHWLIDHIINEDLKLTQCLHTDTDTKHSFLQQINSTLGKRTTLYQRLWIILALPLIFFMLQTLFISYSGYKRYDELREVQRITKTAVIINNVITQLQKERGLSSAYITSGYSHFKKKLEIQRLKTDEVLKESIQAKKYIEPYIDIRHTISTLQKLASIRKEIDMKQFDRKESIDYYTLFIQNLIGTIKSISFLPFNHVDQNTYSPLLLLLNVNEVQGLIRNEGIICLENDGASCNDFQSLLQKKEDYLNAFEVLAPTHLKTAISEIEHTPQAKHLSKLQTLVLHKQLCGNNAAESWFEKMTLHIEKYKKVIETSLHKIEQDACMQEKHFFSLILTIWSIFGIIILIMSLSIVLLKESILKPLKVLTDALHNLSSGNKSIYFTKINKKDAIGRMQRAYNHLRRSLIKADYANILMELQELKTQKYERLSEEDPLTGIYNRRAFMQAINYEVEQAHKSHRPLSVLILDLDHFKQVNDTYGHEIGDHLLKHFVSHTNELTRNSDFFARIGGEEFALLLPNTSHEGAQTLAEKIVKEIAALNLDSIAPGLQMTVSIGIAVHRDNISSKTLLKEADEQLYEAKRSGRNRFCG